MALYSIVLLILIALSFVYLKIAERYNIVDKPNERSSHSEPTIRGGGILFYVALCLFFCTHNFQYPYLVLGVTLIGGVSFIDDLKTLSSKIRLPFQFLAIVLVLMQVNFLDFSWWELMPLLIIGVGFINIYNFMDGINGITGLYSLVVLSGFYMINQETQVVDTDLLIYLMFSIAVFGYYNFRLKARFFAGDIGSISIAVILFFIGGTLLYKIEAPVLLLFVVVYGADAILTIIYRAILGEKIFDPHRRHIYQKLVDVTKTPHLWVAGGYAIVQLMINAIVYFTYKEAFLTQLIVFFSVCIALIISYIVLFIYLNKKKK